jgi:cytochrome c-type biogenesis protein
MSLLLLAYGIAAFIAGIIAVAMPCCFSVLLPSYFALSFKQKKRLIGMTAIFSMGIATIMLPLAFGVSYLGRILGTNHELVFVAGGFLMIVVGFWTLWGEGMLPRFNFPVNLNRADAASVYTLGMFSGAATSCCAPVLAGVLILAALSASLLEGLLIGFTYVLGMVFPLFLVALFWDKFQAGKRNLLAGRMIYLKLWERQFSVHSSKLIAGVMLLAVGVVNILVGLTGTMISAPASAVVGSMQAQLQNGLLSSFSTLSLRPSALGWTIALISIVLLLMATRLRRIRK